MGDQIEVTESSEIIYKSDELLSSVSCPHIHWATNVEVNKCSILFVYIKVWLKQSNPQVHGSQVI